jgi:hypothetical protein
MTKHNNLMMNKWLQQASIAGFGFFLVKGLVWIAIVAWAI